MENVTGADFKSATADENKKLFIETYGCQMNVADSEVIASVMQMAGYSVAVSSVAPAFRKGIFFIEHRHGGAVASFLFCFFLCLSDKTYNNNACN